VDPKRSADYLAGLVEDFFSPWPLEWLPFETLFADAGLRARIGQDEVDDVDRKAFFESLTETLQAADLRTKLAGAVVAPDILDRARRRFKVFLP
jgi:hypothetical protein